MGLAYRPDIDGGPSARTTAQPNHWKQPAAPDLKRVRDGLSVAICILCCRLTGSVRARTPTHVCTLKQPRPRSGETTMDYRILAMLLAAGLAVPAQAQAKPSAYECDMNRLAAEAARD